jgi:predicted DNA-binding antitoxin AbrB/MazE fold protein
MTPLTVEAVYENGVLKPAQPLPLREHETVRITIEPGLTWAERTAGMIPWNGDTEALDRLISDPEFGILESP